LIKPLAGPAHLDRSRSTVWDYGPGRTYSTPQAAFDALVMQEGTDPFGEAHYVRGFGGTHGQGPSGYVLYLTTVAPFPRYPLVIDVAPGAEVGFDDEDGTACLVGNGVSHVRVRDLRLKGAFVGVVAAEDDSEPALDWRVERILADGTDQRLVIGVLAYKADDLRVLHCDFQELTGGGVASHPFVLEETRRRVEVSGCRMRGAPAGIFINSPWDYIIANNTIQASQSAIQYYGSSPLLLAGLINNILLGSSDGFTCLKTDTLTAEDIRILRSDGNCFYPGAEGSVADLAGERLDLAGWQERFDQDQRSLMTDPMLDASLKPLPGSPCLGAGVCWDDRGQSGFRRAVSVDLGFEQESLARVPGATVRQAPEIVRRT
jgi:hypothetical protein